MYNFEFYNPTKIIFGKDRFGDLGNQIPLEANVLITYGGGSVKKYGVLDKVKAALPNRKLVEFGGIEPNPHFETLVKALPIIKENKINFILAVGGGSVIDGTKFINLAANYAGDPADLLKYGFIPVPKNVVGSVFPLGTVLTLPATGSEMNNGAVISYKDGKFPVKSLLSYPVFSLLDPTVTYTLPKIQVANGIVDTFVHTTEQYLTYPVDARLQDRMAEGILQTLIEIGKKTIDNPEDYDTRANLVWCSTMALNGIIGVGVPQDWATHMIGHELTAMFGIDHGQTLAIVHPAILKVRKEQKKAKLLQYAERVWGITSGNDEDRIDSAINKTSEFFESLGIKTRLTEYGVSLNKVPELVAKLKEHKLTALSETRDVTLEVSEKILQEAL